MSSNNPIHKVTTGVIGGGAWGTALAMMLAQNHDDVLLWARENEVVDAINKNHRNDLFLPDCPLSPSIRATTDMAQMRNRDIILIVSPAQHVRAALMALMPSKAAIILCAKGIEAQSQKLLCELASEICPDNIIAVLSGPTFAHEVAANKPSAVTFACDDAAQGNRLIHAIATPSFRPYYSDDVIGAEIGGAVKNVLAIACGVVEGAKLGLNARAALIARGYAEMLRYGQAKGARAETMAGLSGLGDLVLTCGSENSRNFALGVGLGQGQSAQSLLSGRISVAEGAQTAPVLQKSANSLGVDMPIVDAVCALLSGESNVENLVKTLLSRPLRSE